MEQNTAPRTRVLIVDDEPLARARIRRFLSSAADIEIIGECGDGSSAVETIQAQNPDLVFLDIQMPGMDGFEVIRSLDEKRLPVIIFITAYDQYALEAFKVHALDYLLKPVEEEVFQQTLSRCRDYILMRDTRRLDARLRSLLDELRSAQELVQGGRPGVAGAAGETGYIDRIAVNAQKKIIFVRVDDLLWIEAEGDYIRLHSAKGSHLIRGKIGDYEKQLNPAHFVRVHRSAIVHIDRIRELHPMFHGDYTIVLQDNAQVTLSRNYRERFESLFKGSL